MQLAIFGTGGVGGYFGGLLANAGHDVAFIARGRHLDAIQQHGLNIRSESGDFNIFPAQATDNPSDIGEVDYVVVAVKHYHLNEAVQQMRPLVGTETTLVPLLNGVDAHTYLIDTYGEERVVGGLCGVISYIEEPGTIKQLSGLRRIVVGELDRSKSERVEHLIQAWKACGVESVHSDDIFVDLWAKFLLITSFGGVTSLARSNAGEILAIEETRNLLTNAMLEVEMLARAQGILLPPDIVNKSMRTFENLEPTATSSMQRDVANGKPFELEAFSGKIVSLSEKFGISTPVHQSIYGLLLPALMRALDSNE